MSGDGPLSGYTFLVSVYFIFFSFGIVLAFLHDLIHSTHSSFFSIPHAYNDLLSTSLFINLPSLSIVDTLLPHHFSLFHLPCTFIFLLPIF